MSTSAVVGVIGGSGLYEIEGLSSVEEVSVDTPFGKPSDSLVTGVLGSVPVVFLTRHGRHHQLLPSEINHRANIFAMKTLGVKWLISVGAVGSLREEIAPGDFVFPLQFFDRTKQAAEAHTFFGRGLVAHVPLGRPVCERLATVLFQSAQTLGIRAFWGGTYVTIEGPAFSTRAESEFHRRLGFDVVGMTGLAEVKLAREAEMGFAAVSMVTDYDCWHTTNAEVEVSHVLELMRHNSARLCKLLAHALPQFSVNQVTRAHTILDRAIVTPRAHWPENVVEELRPILARVLRDGR